MPERVLWTESFRRQYRRYSGARPRVAAVVREVVRRRDALTHRWFDGKRTLQGVDELVYEIKVTHCDRLLVRVKGAALCLVAVGDHDVTFRYARRSPKERESDFGTASPAPKYFDPASDAPIFVDVDGMAEPVWEEELGEDWLHFLSDEQEKVKSDLMDGILAQLHKKWSKRMFVGLLAGGAGTGKTALLLSIALDLHEFGYSVNFRCSPQMRKYLLDYTRINIDKLATGLGGPQVVLLDDPESIETIQTATAQTLFAPSVVVAGYDPLQWWDDKRLSTRLKRLESLGRVYTLKTCYRQSQNLVEMAQEVSRAINDRSSWRADSLAIQNEREFMESLLAKYSDGLRTEKPGGRVKRYDTNLDDAVELEAKRLRESIRWDSLPELLVLIDRGRGVKFKREWKAALNQIRRIDCDIADVPRYRGLDFPSVWIFTTASLLRQVEDGRVGLGGTEWGELRRLHIALTRSKDSTVIFAR